MVEKKTKYINPQNLKRLLILYRLGAPVKNGKVIEKVYDMLQPVSSVFIQDREEHDILCHMDKDGKIIYFTYDDPLSDVKTLELSSRYGLMIKEKIKNLVDFRRNHIEDVLDSIVKGYGINCDVFFYSVVSRLIEYLENKHDIEKVKNLEILP